MDGNGGGKPRPLTDGQPRLALPAQVVARRRACCSSPTGTSCCSSWTWPAATITVVDKARRHDITDYNWSPDSRWLVYSKDGDSGQDAVWVYSPGREAGPSS